MPPLLLGEEERRGSSGSLLYCSLATGCTALQPLSQESRGPGREERVAAVQLTGLSLLLLLFLPFSSYSSTSSSCSLPPYSILTFLSLTGHFLGQLVYFISTVSLLLSPIY